MTDATIPRPAPIWRHAIPFWLSVLLLPLIGLAAAFGGAFLLLPGLYAFAVSSVIDKLTGRDTCNLDPATDRAALFWHRLVTLVWYPAQLFALYGALAAAAHGSHLAGWEAAGLMLATGLVTGVIGINYAHELMHQPGRLDRWLGDLLLASVLYSHFRSEHLLVHHSQVGTPADAVTARKGEGLWRFLARVLPGSFRSALAAEARRQTRRGRPAWHPSNPFWRYAGLQAAHLAVAALIGGWLGLGLFALQAAVAIFHLELVNYIEHYGLTRRHLGEGRYEPVRPHHSWNAAHRFTNWLLINLQRHSDHHTRPDRPFPLLQTYHTSDAPQLPFGYPLMGTIALVPPLWRRVMDGRVDRWRARHYPDISDWTLYDRAEHPVRGL